MPAGDETQPDPGGVQAAVDRYRDLAKYLITVFAGVGGLLVAGTQLASLGKLTLEDNLGRLAFAVAVLAVGIGAIVNLVHAALKVLRPIEMSLRTVEADADLRKDIESRPSMLGGAGTVERLRKTIESPALDDELRKEWAVFASAVTGRAGYLKAKKAFDDSLQPMVGWAVLASAAIAAFAWAANPPEEAASPSPVMLPAPVELQFTLTEDGRETLKEALGEQCVTDPIRAVSVGGKEGEPRVVTIPTGTCKSAQFVLTDELGTPVATKSAPSG